MSGKELLTESIRIPLTKTQFDKLVKKANKEVLPPVTYTRQQLVKTLKLKDDSK